jgi:hypothetical protein
MTPVVHVTRAALLGPLVLSGWMAFASGAVHAAPTADAAVRAVMMKTWDRPEQRLEVDPVVVVGDHALAGWVQGDRGGRALLRKTAQGWQVHVCGGDGLKDPVALRDAGLEASSARSLVAALSDAESRLPAAQVRRFSLFGKNVVVGPDHGAQAHEAAHAASAAPHGH